MATIGVYALIISRIFLLCSIFTLDESPINGDNATINWNNFSNVEVPSDDSLRTWPRSRIPFGISSTTPVSTVSVRTNSKRLIPQHFDERKCMVKSNSILCNEADNYPWREVQRILSSKKLSAEFFGNDSLSTTDPKSHKSDEIHYDRQLCRSVEAIHFPKIAQNSNLDLRYVIQGDSNIFRRGIRTETCLADAECMFSSDFPPHIEVRCVQKYMIKKLIALEPLTGDAYFDEFPVPSCCVCMYKDKDIDYDDT